MQSEESAWWHDLKLASQIKRANNRESSAQLLTNAEIVFTSHNNDAHLIVEGATGYIDFWPGTGRWNCRSGKKGFGVMNLIKYVKES